MTSIPTNYLTATETQALLRDGRVSLDQILADHVARYDNRNAAIGAWVHVNHGPGVMGEKAGGAEEEKPLCGLILGVKDVINTKDMPTEHGCELYRGSRPGVDAAVVELCRLAGAAIIGKTTTTMFAASMVGPPHTHNPVDTRHTPGGSSSGSAAAVADYQCHVALGTQTGGSIIRPASFTGIFGFKPTWGMICRDGAKSFAHTLDTIGFFARSITDIELVSRQLRIFSHSTSSTPGRAAPETLAECRFGFVKTDQFDDHATDDLKSIWVRAQSLLLSAGAASVEEVDLGPKYHGLVGEKGRMGDLTITEGRRNLLREYVLGRDHIDPVFTDWIENDPPLSPGRFGAVQDELAELRTGFGALTSRFDAIITPSVPGEAPVGLGWTGDARFCALWTGLHVPAINVPGFAGSQGLPIGLTLVGPRYGDERLLKVAKLVAEVFIGADEERLKRVPAPDGVVPVQP